MDSKPTGARPKTIDGVIFRCYALRHPRWRGLRYEWRSDDGELAAGTWSSLSTYYAEVGLQRFNNRFRSLENAMRFAMKYQKDRSLSASRSA